MPERARWLYQDFKRRVLNTTWFEEALMHAEVGEVVHYMDHERRIVPALVTKVIMPQYEGDPVVLDLVYVDRAQVLAKGEGLLVPVNSVKHISQAPEQRRCWKA